MHYQKEQLEIAFFFSFIGQYMDSICHRNNVAHLYCTYSSVELKALYGHSH